MFMNINLSSILSGSMRILNIANKALPLIKEMNPTINTIKNKILQGKNKGMVPVVPIKQVPEIKEVPKATPNLTFFK